jgi:hypothetical protein
MINKEAVAHSSKMKNTIIVIAEQAVKNHRTCMMDHLYVDMEHIEPGNFAGDLIQLGTDLKNFLSPDNRIALNTFRDHFRTGSTMTLVDPEAFDQLEAWDNNNEDFRIAIFREDGSAVGIVPQENICW